MKERVNKERSMKERVTLGWIGGVRRGIVGCVIRGCIMRGYH